ncbi:MAG: hypothetical protein AB7F61_14310 [Desulfobulbus sp.]
METMRVRVLPGTVLTDNRTTYEPGDELEMAREEAERRIAQGVVELIAAEAGQPENVSEFTATEKIEAAKAATTIDALEELREGEARKTVLSAIDQRSKELGA